MRRGKQNMTHRIEHPNQQIHKTLGKKETYKNLRILEEDTIKQAKLKERKSVSQENEKATQNQTI